MPRCFKPYSPGLNDSKPKPFQVTTRIYDPQSNELNIQDWMQDINLKKGLKVAKVNGLMFNTKTIVNDAKKR